MRYFSILFVLCLLGMGCSSRKSPNQASLTGYIRGLNTDTLYFYGTDIPYDKVDTIPLKDGRFSFHFSADTAAVCYLQIGQAYVHPILVDKGVKLSIAADKDSLDCLEVKGSPDNEHLSAFFKEFRNTSLAQKQSGTIHFMKNHPHSLANVYLMQRYWLQSDSLQLGLALSLLNDMPGTLQDNPEIERIKAALDEVNKSSEGRYIYYFDLPNKTGKRINRMSESFRQKYLLIHFWASWADSLALKQHHQELKKLYKQHAKSKHLAFLGISFDIDMDSWKNYIKQDSLVWEQVCDVAGAHSEFFKIYTDGHLPSNVLLDPEGRVLKRNLWGEHLKKQLETIQTEAAK